MEYAQHAEACLDVRAAPTDVFAFLDDQEALGAHMSKGSAMMAGGRMVYELDEAKGKSVGSIIGMRGAMLGLALEVKEVVTERVPPSRKVLETIGQQKMLVIAAYRLGFEITPAGAVSSVRVFIDYNLPKGPLGFLADFPAAIYARWCVTSMANAAVERFGPNLTKKHES